ncbi:Protein CBG27864 [Caenorhabditis briggsae]|uniref:Protein CBG27864 n=2 Tax=Caenorhabditis briggsae TaxID=6238 RepID=B6IEF9_CAEBR|nr:Protein CBG27864 [Caenorhabditis briggsae]CAR98289.1 Protein CBG27864 [Caenorhabditis briggsae]
MANTRVVNTGGDFVRNPNLPDPEQQATTSNNRTADANRAADINGGGGLSSFLNLLSCLPICGKKANTTPVESMEEGIGESFFSFVKLGYNQFIVFKNLLFL